MDNAHCFDPSRFVPPSFQSVVRIREQGCPANPPRKFPRVDYAKQLFCQNWGPSFKCLCPNEPRNYCWQFYKPSETFGGVTKEINSLNYFSALPLRPEGCYPRFKDPPTMSQKQGLVSMFRDKCASSKSLAPSMRGLCGTGFSLRESLFTGDASCGACAPTSSAQPILTNPQPFKCDDDNDDFPGFDISCKMPFKICFPKPSQPEKIKLRTGAEVCLKPSSYHYLKSTHRSDFRDFMKLKTVKQLSMYRSPLVIDNRRPRPKIPRPEDDGNVVDVNGGPMIVNAKPIRWKAKKGRNSPSCAPQRPDYEICTSGPINIPCADFELDPEEYKKLEDQINYHNSIDDHTSSCTNPLVLYL